MTASWTRTNTRLNVALDTNQYLSVFLFCGQLVKLIVELILANKLTLFVSPALRSEVQEKLTFYGASMEQIQEDALALIDKKGRLVTPIVAVTVCRDSEDNFALELAEAARAHYLLTRDKDLLSSSRMEGDNHYETRGLFADFTRDGTAEIALLFFHIPLQRMPGYPKHLANLSDRRARIRIDFSLPA